MPSPSDTTPSGGRITSGRQRRNTDKVQAQLDEQKARQVRKQKELEQAEIRKERQRKRDQVTTAASKPPRQLPAHWQNGTQPVQHDPAFTSRSVGSIARPSLVARQGNVPPSAPYRLDRQKTATPVSKSIPAHARALTVEKAAKLAQLRAPSARARKSSDESYHQDPANSRENSPSHSESEPDTTSGSLNQGSRQRSPMSRQNSPEEDFEELDAGDHDPESDADADASNLRAGDKRTRGSQIGHSKRHRSAHSNDSDNEEEEAQIEIQEATAIRASANRGRPKAADYEANVRAVLKVAIEIYRGLLLSENPYPDDVEESEWSQASWARACDALSFLIAPTPDLLKLIKSRGSHLRGELKTKSRPIVANLFNFETSADDLIQEGNRKLVAELKQDNAFIYRERGDSLDEHKGIYGSKAIQQVINEILYKNKHDEGITWASEFYCPFPNVGLALVLTAIECCIDEWAHGTRNKVAFTEEEYKSVFEAHLQSLQDLEEHSKEYDLVPKLLRQIYNNGRVHAKAELVMQTTSRVVSKQAIENAIREALSACGAVINED